MHNCRWKEQGRHTKTLSFAVGLPQLKSSLEMNNLPLNSWLATSKWQKQLLKQLKRSIKKPKLSKRKPKTRKLFWMRHTQMSRHLLRKQQKKWVLLKNSSERFRTFLLIPKSIRMPLQELAALMKQPSRPCKELKLC
jgi:hypothetical protein